MIYLFMGFTALCFTLGMICLVDWVINEPNPDKDDEATIKTRAGKLEKALWCTALGSVSVLVVVWLHGNS